MVDEERQNRIFYPVLKFAGVYFGFHLIFVVINFLFKIYG